MSNGTFVPYGDSEQIEMLLRRTGSDIWGLHYRLMKAALGDEHIDRPALLAAGSSVETAIANLACAQKYIRARIIAEDPNV